MNFLVKKKTGSILNLQKIRERHTAMTTSQRLFTLTIPVNLSDFPVLNHAHIVLRDFVHAQIYIFFFREFNAI